MKQFNEKIRKLREDKGITQEKMADLLNVSRVAYGQIETGKTKSISLDMAIGISRVFGVSFNELFEIEDSNSAELKKENEDRENERQFLMEQLRKKRKELEDKDLIIDLLKKENLEYKRDEYSKMIYDILEDISPLEAQLYSESDEAEKEKAAFLLKEEIQVLKGLFKKCLDEKIYPKEDFLNFFPIEVSFWERFANTKGGKREFYKNLTKYLNQFYDISEHEVERHLNRLLKKNAKDIKWLENLKKKYNFE